MFHKIEINKEFYNDALHLQIMFWHEQKVKVIKKAYTKHSVASVHSAGKDSNYSYLNIEYFLLVSFIILQSKPAIGLFISANLMINCSFYGLTAQVIPTGTEHLTGQMIEHSLL